MVTLVRYGHNIMAAPFVPTFSGPSHLQKIRDLIHLHKGLDEVDKLIKLQKTKLASIEASVLQPDWAKEKVALEDLESSREVILKEIDKRQDKEEGPEDMDITEMSEQELDTLNDKWAEHDELETHIAELKSAPEITQEIKEQILQAMLNCRVLEYVLYENFNVKALATAYEKNASDIAFHKKIIEEIEKQGNLKNVNVTKTLLSQKNTLAILELDQVDLYEKMLYQEEKNEGDEFVNDANDFTEFYDDDDAPELYYEWEDLDTSPPKTNLYPYQIICPDCYSGKGVIHMHCGEFADICICPSETEDYYCTHCSITFTPDEAEPDDEFVNLKKNGFLNADGSVNWSAVEEIAAGNKLSSTKSNIKVSNGNVVSQGKTYSVGASSGWSKSCEHLQQPIALENDLVVHATSHYEVHSIKVAPDFGLYAASVWANNVSWRNEFIHWPDGSIPSSSDVALEQIRDAYKKVVNGFKVDVGCIGAHGRTGTILAIMYLLSTDGKATPEDCCKYIWNNYCVNAIETKSQEWFVAYAAGYFYGVEVPEKPTYSTYSYSYSGQDGSKCFLSDHVAMHFRGWKECLSSKTCTSFEKDVSTYVTGNAQWAKNVAEGKMGEWPLQYGGTKIASDKEHTCQPIEHYVMLHKGHEVCLWSGSACKHWEDDKKLYLLNGSILGSNQGSIEFPALMKLFPDPDEIEETESNQPTLEFPTVTSEVIDVSSTELDNEKKEAQ